jgi:divalent metal cation (Fe/Co/Zn/Cd) transporter
MAGTRAIQVQRGLYLEYFTIAYNSLEGLIAIGFGLLSGSIALIGFGLDSVIEVTSGATLVWRLRADGNLAVREEVERKALRIVGVCFLALAIYVTYEAAESLLSREEPRRTIPGIVLAIVSMIVMPWLAHAKRRVAGRIGSSALTADAKQTEVCMYLSAILLAGLLLNALFGWWWADPVAALAMVPIIVREGRSALRGQTCCASCR